ncbi:hypothetical protein D9611_012861 [Ephemerocybe angulata]|uniref:Ubiquitin-like domain-containing protein n=1 Tax=Ephemerocybe angulata TaxID=980116 RepID=A0A8H5BAR9_9AGAR|nr:hypothetical protein D9611_012861 [Tulosesus angulatus]
MKLPLAPLVSLLFGASYLVANTIAYSYHDYNELDARYQIDDVLSERGFGLEARETIDVPFQPSLRAFLEEAATAHRRSMSENEDLEARADPINVYIKILDQHIDLKVDPGMKVTALKELVAKTKRVPGIDMNDFVPRHNELYGKKFIDDESKTLADNGVTEGSKIFFRKKLTLDFIVKVGQEERRVQQMKVSDDLTPSSTRVLVEAFINKNEEFPIGPADVFRILGTTKNLNSRGTLHANKVPDGATIEIIRNNKIVRRPGRR